MTIASREIFRLDYGGKLERQIASLMAAFEEIQFDTGRYPKRWLAIKLLEADPDILARVQAMPNGRYEEVAGNHMTMLYGEGARQIVAAITEFITSTTSAMTHL